MQILSLQEIQSYILDVPNFPKPGVMFKDITPLFENIQVFTSLISHMSEMIPAHITKLVAVESRGFILASALATQKQIPFCLARKPNKLPRETFKQIYDLEYGRDELHLHKTSLKPHDCALVIDDVLATGGTARAVENLCQKADCKKVESLFLLELSFLNASKNLKKPYQSLFKIT